ncbi:MAG: hypothetical protein U9N57_05860 [Pseudomonadota bacterium]|nr:hypothetical protein [Pseudomonadota bacterium]
MSTCVNRFPVVYDFDDLKNQIRELVKSGLECNFFESYPKSDEIYQGDVIELDASWPFIDENGDIAILDEESSSNLWVVLGNTCDITRCDLPYTNIIPLSVIEDDVDSGVLTDLKAFQNFKKIYFPDAISGSKGFMIDFTKICTIDKNFLIKSSEKKSQLTHESWVLFHSCIVRYFARDDGRNDPD